MDVPKITTTLPQTTAPSAESGLGKDAFLKLLLTQLRNQDPMKPMDDQSFITQLAQFNSLEQMQAMQKTLADALTLQKLAQATGLIGHTVSGKLSSGKEFSAPVTEVQVGKDGPILVTKAGPVALSDVVKVV